MNAVAKKADSAEIESFLAELGSRSWLERDARKWWPRFVFHYTDIRNALEILKSGELLCRQKLENKKRMPVDNASPIVINATGNDVKQYVRLYFRPKTPTQYRNEGIRPKAKLELGGAHCPVPIFFLFDSKEILTYNESWVSDGNLATSRYRLGNDVAFLRDLPFNKIYHTGSYNSSLNPEIKFHRNAEVIVPERLDLSALRYIICRSPAERDSLFYLLPTRTWKQWHKKIHVNGRLNLFEQRWTFVERVDLSETQITFHFSPDTETPGPFNIYFELVDTVNDQEYEIKQKSFSILSCPNWGVEVPTEVSSYSVRLELDGSLAYANEFSADDIPF